MRELALSDCGRWLSGGTPDTDNPAYWGGDIPWITASSLKGRYLSRSVRQLTDAGVVAGSRLVDPGTLVFVVRGMSLKNEFRVGIATKALAFGQDCKALVPREGIDSKYLLFAMEAAEDLVLRMVDEASHGTGRLQSSLLGSLKVRIPPLDEQLRIAEVVDTVDETIQATERVIAKLEVERAGLLQQVFGRSVWDPRFEVTQIRSMLQEKPKNGRSPVEANTWQGTYMLGLGCLGSRGFLPSQLKFAPSMQPSLASALLHDGDLLISRSNTRERVGFVGTYRDVGEPCIYPDLMMRLVVRPEVRTRFLELALQSGPARRQIEANASGTSGSMVKITGATVMALSVPRVDLAEQEAVVALFARHGTAVDAEEQTLQKLRQLRLGLASDLLSGRVLTVAA